MSALIKAVSYLRMSTGRQEKSIADQRTEVEQYAVANNYKVVREYCDEGISGSKSEERKGFQRLIADATERHDFQVILVWDQSRFSRFDPMEANYYWYLLDQAGVKLVTVTQGEIDWHSLAGWLTASIEQHGKAQVLRDNASSTTRALRKLKSEGKWISGAAYGYKLEGTESGKSLVLGDPDEVLIVKRIFEMRIAGYGVSHISAALNAEHIPSPMGKKWSAPGVSAILERRAYCGDAVIGQHSCGRYETIADEISIVLNAHEPI
jgi:DNA invertase Pin-like site-specific DNA recombinase